MRRVDGFVVAVPKARVAEYEASSRKAGEVWRSTARCSTSSAPPTTCPTASSPRSPARSKREDETVVLAWIAYESRQHRDAVDAEVMADPRIREQMDMSKAPFDGRRMIFGGSRRCSRCEANGVGASWPTAALFQPAAPRVAR